MSSRNELKTALETLKSMNLLNSKAVNDILTTQRMSKRERKLWIILRIVIVHLRTTAKIEAMLIDDYILTDQWLDGFYDYFVEMINDVNKAIGRIPKLERDLKRLKKKKQEIELLITKNYEEALKELTKYLEERKKAQKLYGV
jgi:hypothetical protein